MVLDFKDYLPLIDQFKDFYLSRKHLVSLFDNGEIKFFQNGKTLHYNEKVKGKVEIVFEDKNEIIPCSKSLNIIYEDDDYLLVYKLRGMLIHSSEDNDALVNSLSYYFTQQNYFTIPRINTRLDRDCEGLVLVSKNILTAAYVDYLIRERKIIKKYYVAVKGHFSKPSGKMINYISRDRHENKMIVSNHGKIAKLSYKVLKTSKDYSLVDIDLETGIKHQIRIQMAASNHPVVGDDVYGKGDKTIRLQCYKISFFSIFKNKIIDVIIPISNKLKELFYYE